MNVHHLELFHHVARNGGVSAAARAMPYGIQQPAISSQILQAALRQRGIEWMPSLEVGSLDLILRFVAEGFGAGLALRHPRVELPAGVRSLELDDFPPLSFGAIWSGRLSPLGEVFLAEAATLAGELATKMTASPPPASANVAPSTPTD